MKPTSQFSDLCARRLSRNLTVSCLWLGLLLVLSPLARVQANPVLATVAADIIKLDDPQGTYTLEALNGSKSVTLVGRIKTLEVGGLNGEAVMDSSGLQVETIRFTGAINGQTKMVLSAPQGRVVFAESINGEPEIRLTARVVEFLRPVNGGSRLNVTLAAGGSLKFTELGGSSELSYQRASPSDPSPVVVAGQLLGGARLLERKP